MMSGLFSLIGICARYGLSQVLFDISIAIDEGQCVSLLGRNGMGKSSAIKCMSGLLPPSSGEIEFCGNRITGWMPHRIARIGMGLVPEGRHVFPNLTVRENLIATAANRTKAPNPWTLGRIYKLFPRLEERRGNLGMNLSGGEQQMLAIGRALLTNPRLLILDEATEGLSPLIRKEIWDCLAMLKDEGLSILVVDKNLDALGKLCQRHYVFEKGHIVWSGTSENLIADHETVSSYMGV
jgi:branched-chain amino acid transport system ATP-binding protein